MLALNSIPWESATCCSHCHCLSHLFVALGQHGTHIRTQRVLIGVVNLTTKLAQPSCWQHASHQLPPKAELFAVNNLMLAKRYDDA